MMPVLLGFATAHVEVTGCTMTLNADTSSSLNCGATGHIVMTTTFFGSVCTLIIGGNQSFAVKSVEFTNTKSTHPWDVDVHQHVTGVTYVVSGGGGACGSVGHHTDGKMEGTVTSRCHTACQHLRRLLVGIARNRRPAVPAHVNGR
jgi:hypothetical protein